MASEKKPLAYKTKTKKTVKIGFENCQIPHLPSCRIGKRSGEVWQVIGKDKCSARDGGVVGKL